MLSFRVLRLPFVSVVWLPLSFRRWRLAWSCCSGAFWSGALVALVCSLLGVAFLCGAGLPGLLFGGPFFFFSLVFFFGGLFSSLSSLGSWLCCSFGVRRLPFVVSRRSGAVLVSLSV